MRVSRKVIAVSLCLPFLLLASITPADANLGAQTSNGTAQSLSTVTFKVAPEATTNGTATGIITWTAGAANANFYAYYVNTGTVNDAAFSWTVTRTVGTNSYTLDYCPTDTTFSSATLCSDSSTPTTMALTGTGPALAVGQWMPIHIKISKKNDAFTVAATVSASQIRTATNTVA